MKNKMVSFQIDNHQSIRILPEDESTLILETVIDDTLSSEVFLSLKDVEEFIIGLKEAIEFLNRDK